jgi:hypothetical protein
VSEETTDSQQVIEHPHSLTVIVLQSH